MAEWEEGKNPLMIELVIDNIAKYLSFEELKVCRELNHLWKKTTSKIFLKLCSQLFLDHLPFPPTKDDGEVSYNKKMLIPQFMEIYSDPENPHPHAQLIRQYRNFSLLSLGEEWIPAFYNFMAVVGPQMTSLVLMEAQVLRNSQDLADIITSKYTPNLEQLKINDLNDFGNYQQSDSEMVRIEGKQNTHLRQLSLHSIPDEIQWLDVLSLCPNLKTLSVTLLAANTLEEIATSLVVIRKVNERKLKLTELEISEVYYFGDSEAKSKCWQRIVDQLKAANLPLEKVSLDDSTSEISSLLIQHYVESLKKLTLKGCIPQHFPLVKDVEEMSVIHCPDLTFLTKVPNIESLSFEPFPEHGLQTRFPESPPSGLVSLTKFEGGNWKKWNVIELEQLLLWMPNVEHLVIYLNCTTFPLICQRLPNLKELIVIGEDLNDYGVVGDVDATSGEGSCFNITNLKALETFTMASRPIFNYGLTERSVYCGFCLLPKLSNLTINVKSKLSADAMLALTRAVKNVNVEVAKKEDEDSDSGSDSGSDSD